MAIDESRETVASAFNCLPGEITFTSSGTEAANLAIIGTALKYRDGNRKRILLGSTEHHCVLNTAPFLRGLGYNVELIPAIPGGWMTRDAFADLIDENTLLASVMHANNETGAINDIPAISNICANNGVLLFCDCVQTFGLVPLPSAGTIAISAHKIYGPKGAGALFARAGISPAPLIVGGGQEREMRAGTEDVAAIVGLAEAVKLATEDKQRATIIREVRDEFVHNSPKALGFTAIDKGHVLPTHAHFRLPGASAETMLINLDRLGVYASSGAACSSGSIEPSHVLLASGLNEKEASEGLRFTFGKDSTLEDAHEAANRLSEAAAQVLSSVSR
jgi:cysteine desulfurase